ncbi:MAG TPA: flagellar export chaperone FliS [Terriglobia bacterium]|nr:flagellar export chaperone FliS [Terriglobia bacterium]
MRQPALAYRQFSVQTATPLGLVVMLYDGAITAMRGAVSAIEAHDVPNKCIHLNRAQAIILQLEGTLNFEQGGEVAQTLQALYVHARAQILKANIENSAEILRALIEQISTVREAWYEADHRPSNSPSTPTSEASPREAYETEQPSSSTRAREDSPYASSPPREPGSWRVSA